MLSMEKIVGFVMSKFCARLVYAKGLLTGKVF